jgi:RNA recognition motif-containing protein
MILCGFWTADPVTGLAAFLFPVNRRRWIEMNVMLYIGNLAKSTSEDELKSLFEQVGEVTTIRIMKDRSNGESRGFGFLTMSAQSEADKAVSRFNTYSLANNKLKVTLVKPRTLYSPAV